MNHAQKRNTDELIHELSQISQSLTNLSKEIQQPPHDQHLPLLSELARQLTDLIHHDYLEQLRLDPQCKDVYYRIFSTLINIELKITIILSKLNNQNETPNITTLLQNTH